MGSFGGAFKRIGQKIGTSIGAEYAKQGKSWDEVASMPSSGGGPAKNAIHSSVKTGYDNYMAKNKPAPVSASSSNMIQAPSVSDIGTTQEPTLTSGVQNPTADSTQFGNMTNGLGESKFGKNNVIQSQNGNTGLGTVGDSNNTNELNNNTEIVSNSLEMPKFGLGKIDNNYKIVGGTNLI